MAEENFLFTEVQKQLNKLCYISDEINRDFTLSKCLDKINKALIIDYAETGNDEFFTLAKKYSTYDSGQPALRSGNYKIAIHCLIYGECDFSLNEMVELLPHCDDKELRNVIEIIQYNYDDELEEIISNSDKDLAERLRKLTN